MATASEQSTTMCSNCDKTIPTPNINLHVAHCIRNLERCKFCRQMVPKRQVQRHYSNKHVLVACKICGGTVERSNLAMHKCESCPLRILTCEYCNFRLPASELFEHQEVCPNEIQSSHRCCRGRREVNATRRAQEGTRAWPLRQFLYTAAIAGAAIFVGSVFFQRNNDMDN